MPGNSKSMKQALRRKAEARLGDVHMPTEGLSPDDLKALVHDYRIYQIELELQNEELRDTQKQLEATRDRFARLFNDAPAGYLIIDESGIIAQSNQTFASMIGRELHHLPGKPLADFISAEDLAAFHGRFKAFFKSPAGKQMQFRLQGKNGGLTVRCVGRMESILHAQPEGQAPRHLLLVVNDVSEQVRAEDILLKREKYLSAVLETTQDGFWVLDGTGRVVEVNNAYCRMSGYTRDELLQLCIPDLEAIEKPEETSSRIQRIIAAGSEQFETRHRRKDGSLIDVEVSVSHHEDDGDHFFCFCRDITQRREADLIIKDQNDQLKTLLTVKDKFFSIIAHDLKSPISGLLSLSRMFLEDAESLTIKELHQVASAMFKSSERLYALLENLLHWALMQQGVVEYSPKTHDLKDLVHAGMEFLRSVAEQKNVAIHSRIPENLFVRADEPMISTVLRNLVSNALKFTDKGGSVLISADRDGDMVTVAVQDTGMGMSKDILDQVFTLGKKTVMPGLQGEKGTGLGLVLCKEFIEKHGGRIWAQSEQGKGATFFFAIPKA